MKPFTIVFWENEPQFVVFNPKDASREAAEVLEDRLYDIIEHLDTTFGDDWDCADFRSAVNANGLDTGERIPANDKFSGFWRFDV